MTTPTVLVTPQAAAASTHRKPCQNCGGDGGDPASMEALIIGGPEVKTKTCPTCNGTGSVPLMSPWVPSPVAIEPGTVVTIKTTDEMPERWTMIGPHQVVSWWDGDGGTGWSLNLNGRLDQPLTLIPGHVYGTATVAECAIVTDDSEAVGSAYWGPACIEVNPATGYLRYWPAWDGAQEYDDGTDISDALPFSDWSPICTTCGGKGATWDVYQPPLGGPPEQTNGERCTTTGCVNGRRQTYGLRLEVTG